MNLTSRWWVGAALALASCLCHAQLAGEFNFSAVSGRGPSHWLNQGHVSRLQVSYDSGPWRLVGSEFFYPFCDFNQLDETTLTYQAGPWRARAGRFIPVVGSSGWYDQWDTGYVFLPEIEHRYYFNRQTFWLTSLGADVEYRTGPTSITIGGVDSGNPADQAAPKSLRRLNARVQTMVKGVVVGAGAFIDPSEPAGEKIFDIDFRAGWDHWTIRGAVMASTFDSDRYQGAFVDFAHRPPGQDWLTLIGRYEVSNENSKAGPSPFGFPQPAIHRELHAFTFGSKVQLGSEWFLSVNYRTGTQRPPMGYQNGWVFGLNRTFRF